MMCEWTLVEHGTGPWYIMSNSGEVIGELYTNPEREPGKYFMHMYHPPLPQGSEWPSVSILTPIPEEQWNWYVDHPDEFYMEWLL